MADSDKQIENQILETGEKLTDPPSSLDELLSLLDVSSLTISILLWLPAMLTVWISRLRESTAFYERGSMFLLSMAEKASEDVKLLHGDVKIVQVRRLPNIDLFSYPCSANRIRSTYFRLVPCPRFVGKPSKKETAIYIDMISGV
ncbi:hypothetical protein Bca101_056293 [Brassica carinata]